MYEMKQLTQRKVTQGEAAAYFDAVFNNTSLSIADQEENIIQFYRNIATPNPAKEKSEPNGRAMTKVMDMFNGQDVVQSLAQPKIPPMVYCAVLQSLPIMNVVP